MAQRMPWLSRAYADKLQNKQQKDAFKKFSAPPTPLEREEGETVMKPSNQWKVAQFEKLMEEKLSELGSNTPAGRAWQLKKLHHYFNQTAQSADGLLEDKFVTEFCCWLMGKSKYNENTTLTPWGPQRLVGKSIEAYLLEFFDKKTTYELELQKLAAKCRIAPPTTIEEAWIYFKYIVTRSKEDVLPDQFLTFDEGYLPDMDYWLRSVQKVTLPSQPGLFGRGDRYYTAPDKTGVIHWKTPEYGYNDEKLPQPNKTERQGFGAGDPGYECEAEEAHLAYVTGKHGNIAQPNREQKAVIRTIRERYNQSGEPVTQDAPNARDSSLPPTGATGPNLATNDSGQSSAPGLSPLPTETQATNQVDDMTADEQGEGTGESIEYDPLADFMKERAELELLTQSLSQKKHTEAENKRKQEEEREREADRKRYEEYLQNQAKNKKVEKAVQQMENEGKTVTQEKINEMLNGKEEEEEPEFMEVEEEEEKLPTEKIPEQTPPPPQENTPPPSPPKKTETPPPNAEQQAGVNPAFVEEVAKMNDHELLMYLHKSYAMNVKSMITMVEDIGPLRTFERLKEEFSREWNQQTESYIDVPPEQAAAGAEMLKSQFFNYLYAYAENDMRNGTTNHRTSPLELIHWLTKKKEFAAREQREKEKEAEKAKQKSQRTVISKAPIPSTSEEEEAERVAQEIAAKQKEEEAKVSEKVAEDTRRAKAGEKTGMKYQEGLHPKEKARMEKINKAAEAQKQREKANPTPPVRTPTPPPPRSSSSSSSSSTGLRPRKMMQVEGEDIYEDSSATKSEEEKLNRLYTAAEGGDDKAEEELVAYEEELNRKINRRRQTLKQMEEKKSRHGRHKQGGSQSYGKGGPR
jgi:hypothetical protein